MCWRRACHAVCALQAAAHTPVVTVCEPHVHAVLAGEGVCAEECVRQRKRLAGQQQAGNRRRAEAHLRSAPTAENLEKRRVDGSVRPFCCWSLEKTEKRCVERWWRSLTFHVADLRLAVLPLYDRALLILKTRSLSALHQASSGKETPEKKQFLSITHANAGNETHTHTQTCCKTKVISEFFMVTWVCELKNVVSHQLSLQENRRLTL